MLTATRSLSTLSEVFSPGFAVHGRAGEASLQVSAMSQRSVECRLAGACSEELRSKSLTTRCRPGQRRRQHPSTGRGFLVRKPQYERVRCNVGFDNQFEDAGYRHLTNPRAAP